MSKVKKRKIDTECRVFKESWGTDYFVVERNNNVLCLICSDTIAVIKEYNVKRHYQTKHATQFDKYKDQIRKDKYVSLKRFIETQQSFFAIAKKNTEVSVKVSFKIEELIASRGNSFSSREFIRVCLTILVDQVCPEKKKDLENISLSRRTVTRRIKDMNEDI